MEETRLGTLVARGLLNRGPRNTAEFCKYEFSEQFSLQRSPKCANGAMGGGEGAGRGTGSCLALPRLALPMKVAQTKGNATKLSNRGRKIRQFSRGRERERRVLRSHEVSLGPVVERKGEAEEEEEEEEEEYVDSHEKGGI
ncbi:hypothetical protein E2C01_027055 [Portunus trituberculatus]|uniref:Uncharacterized protein n=1 Tax=Portunus trituberculatus TaxID=210409 RepID=A0A5B7EKC4_PORTR|nr:hypothetical protein [Portunus trituberculatus]